MSKRCSSSTSTQGHGVVLCKHNVACVVNTSGTEMNPGRQFYGCRYWKNEKKTCGFFRWVHGMVDEVDEETCTIGSSQLKLEDNMRIAESKAERRKKENRSLVEELSRLMKTQEVMLAEGRRLAHDIRLIRYHFTVVVVVNFILLVLLWQHLVM
ncbi:unnamed protein product [Linum trigynum]|uniref:GRF-type domain-containing protein n=1 Tax=Linum trigynum TaxID=586398 RepID=A0AAV2DYE9_9ROSI